ncbi:FaeA/PapI family transcriptional regulator [Stutzerimonas stutzeri]|uniref:DUF7740 domain-containing protein n=1 Tax=Stutzerimonas stutzeri TaxID=316 RepID=UPI00265ADF18|nr:FaeA/PapI family transcriptional regulator [Stutzerimonas stutzeri]MCF6782617.1 hypothetical protein [Stutzerimonas stutzeri]MCF6805722.1 hypothetical protein [Stutzerimonas stutzeri]
MNLLRYLTNPEGITTAELAVRTGASVVQVRAELVALEAAGAAVRERAAIGQPHRWWRVGARPLGKLDVLLAMVLAARLHPGTKRVRAVFDRLAQRSADPAVSQILSMARRSRAPHQLAELALSYYAEESERGV